MTTSVNQAWAAVLPDRAKADTPGQSGNSGETGFADAVGFGAVAKQARHSADSALAGEARSRRSHVEFKLPDRLFGEPLTADGDADELDDSTSEASKEPASPDERAAGETPFALRSQLPPIILLGALGRHQAGLPSDDDAEADSPPFPRSHASAAALQGAEAGDARTRQGPVAPLTKSASEDGEPKPVPIVGKHPANPPGGGLRGDAATEPDATAKPVSAESGALPDGRVASTATARGPSHDNASDAPDQAGRVTVLAQPNVPAPAAPFPGLTAAPLLAAITGDGSWRELAASADLRGLPSQSAVASTHSLKVQLHPAELGVVNASLRFAGEQLTVELHVESVEAQQRLNADADTIVKSLRALGLEVDRVTVQQSTIVQASNTRPDANAGSGGQPAPDRQSFNAASSGSGNGQAGSKHSGGNTNNGSQASQNTAPGGADRASGGLYI